MHRRMRLHCSERTPRTSIPRREWHSSAPDQARRRRSTRYLPSHRYRHVSDCDEHRQQEATYQRVVSKMAECELKNVEGAQSVAGQKAMGLPQLSGSGSPEEMSEGILLRGKNQTEMPLSTHCTASTTSITLRPHPQGQASRVYSLA